MNNRVTLNNPPNPTAGVLLSPFVDTWASVRAMGGAEMDKAQQFAQRSTHLVTIPCQPGVQQSMVFSLIEGGNTRYFQIEYIEDPDERHIELRCMAFEMNQNAGSAS